jgi:general secretion pathway protein A
MYKNFFGLRENPFNVNPDPRYLFLTPRAQEALSGLMYGVRMRKGFILLTGEVGTGKTTLINHLLDWLHKQRTPTAFIFNSHLGVSQLFDFVLADFGIPVDTRTKSNVMMRLNEWLLERYRAGQTPVLIVDEAQNLPLYVLEEIRLLLNLETPSEKLLQIVLAGQPELEEKLKRPELRQLRQRIMLRCKTMPLDPEEIHGYIHERLRIAGAPGEPIFAPEAIHAIHRHSRGIPRVVNLLCEHALVNAYVDQVKPVPAHIVDAIAREFQLDEVDLLSPGSASGAPTRAGSAAEKLTLTRALTPPPSAAEPPSKEEPLAPAAPVSEPVAEVTLTLSPNKAPEKSVLVHEEISTPKPDLESPVSHRAPAIASVLLEPREEEKEQPSVPTAHASAAAAEPVAQAPASPTETAPLPIAHATTVAAEEKVQPAAPLARAAAAATQPIAPAPSLAQITSPFAARPLKANEETKGQSSVPAALASAAAVQPAAPAASSLAQTAPPFAVRPLKVNEEAKGQSSVPAALASAAAAQPVAPATASPAQVAAFPVAQPLRATQEFAISPASTRDWIPSFREPVVQRDEVAKTKRSVLRLSRKSILAFASVVMLVVAGGSLLAYRGLNGVATDNPVLRSEIATPAPSNAARPAEQAAVQSPPQTQSRPSLNAGGQPSTRAAITSNKVRSPAPVEKRNLAQFANRFATPVLKPRTNETPAQELPPQVTGSISPQASANRFLPALSSPAAPAPSSAVKPAPSSPAKSEAPKPASGRAVQAIRRAYVLPVYPHAARVQNVQGDVTILAEIDERGKVGKMKVISGPVLLQDAALEALSKWKYEPAKLDGQPMPSELLVTIQFRL